jgi:hypothetical protein
MELDKVEWDEWACYKNSHRLQPMQKQKHKLGDNVPATATIFHYNEEGSHLSHHIVPNTVIKAIEAMKS